MEVWELCSDQKKSHQKSNHARMHSNLFMGNRIYLTFINVFSVAIDQLNVSLLNTIIIIIFFKYLTDPTSQYDILCITIIFIKVLQKCPNTFEAIVYSYCSQRTTLVYFYHKLTGNVTP